MTSHECSNSSCALAGQPVAAAVAEALGGKCPACQGPLESGGSGLSGTAHRVIETYPYPIALPLQLLAGKTDVEARAKSLVDVLTNALKFQAMVVQSEYLRSDLVDEDLTAIIRKDLGRPLVSAWVKFIEAAVPRMEAAGVAPFIAELGPAYARAETGREKDDQIEVPGKGYHDEEGEFVETRAKLGLVRALINYRNKFAHGFNQPEEESRQELDFYLGVLDQLLEELAWMADYTLLKREDGKVWRMMGAEPEVADIEWPQQAVDTGLALLAPDGQRVLPLFPLFIVPRQYVAETKAGEDLLVYDQDTGKRIVYVSPRGHHREIQGTLRPWRKLVAAKEVVLPPLDAAALTPEETLRRAGTVTRDTEDNLLAARKLLKGVYVNRPDAEVHLRPFPATSFPLALVTAQAGAGKTTLLHHMAREWAEANASVVFTRAMSIEGTDVMAWLRKELRLAASVTAEELASRGASEERPLLLVIDGLNEHGEREALLASLLELASAVREARHLKVLVSWRAEYADWAAAAKDHASSFLPGPEGGSDDDSAPSLHLGPWAHEEVASLWKRLGGSDKKRFVPRFTHEDVYSTSRSLADLLKNPLLLRLLLETFHGKGLPEEVTRQGLFDAWMARLGERTGDGNRFMLDVARLLMESGSASVALDALYEDSRTAEEARRTDVAAPFTRLLRREGVLTLVPGEPPLVAFAMDRYMERAAGAALVDDGRGQEPGDLVALLEELGEHPLAEEIVESALSIRVREEGRDYLWDFIDALPEGSSSSAGRIAGDLLGRLIQQGEDAERLASELMAEPSESDLHAAISAGRYLDGENEYRLMLDFLAGVAERASGEALETEAMGDLLGAAASAAATLNDWQRCREWNERALALRLRLFGEEHADVASSYNNLGALLSNLGEYEQAREYSEKSLGIQLRLFGEEHANVALSYNNLGLLLSNLGEYEQAREYYEKSLGVSLRLFGEEHADVATSYTYLGQLLSNLGEYEQAREYSEKSLGIQLRLFGEEHAHVATSYNNLGLLLSNLGEYEQAREYYEKSLGVYLRLFGEEHADVATSYTNLGGLLSDLGEYEQAREYSEKSLGVSLRLFGEEHTNVALSYNNLGLLLSKLGEYEQAREYYEKSLGVSLQLFGEEHTNVALSYNNLGALLSDLGEDEQAREYYEKSLGVYLRLFGEEHANVALSYNNLGLLLSKLGEYEQAREYYEKSLGVSLRLFGEEHANVALSYNNLGLLLSKLGEYEQAREYSEKSLGIQLRLFGEEHAHVATSYNNLGLLLSNLGEYEQAREYYEKSLGVYLRLFGEEHADVATSYTNLGGLLSDLGEYEQAREYYDKSLGVYLRLFGEEHADVAMSYNNLGALLSDLGEDEQAREYYEKSLGVDLRLFGEEHAAVATSYNNLGLLLSNLGEYEQAREYYEKSLGVYLRLFGEEHADVAMSYNNLGALLSDLGEDEQAREYYEKSLGVQLRLFGEEHAHVATSYNNLGLLLSNLGEYEQAREYYEKSLGVYLRLFGEEHADVALSYNNLGALLSDLGEDEQAREYYEKSLGVDLRLFGEEHAAVATSYNNLGSLLSDRGEYEQAREYLEKSLGIRLQLFGEEHADVAMSYINLGQLLKALGEYEQAREYLEKSLGIQLRLFGEEHAHVASSYSNLGNLLSDLGEYEQAREYYEKSLGVDLRLFGEEHANVATSYNNLGLLLSDLGEYEQAREYYEKSLGIKLRLFGEEHADVAASRDLLGDVLVQLDLPDEARAQYEQAAAHGNGWSMWTLAQADVDDVDSVEGAEQVLAWVRGAAEFGVEAAAGVLREVDGMGPMETVARIRELLAENEGE